MRDTIIAACEQAALGDLSRIDDDSTDGDTIYAVDRVSENVLTELFESEIAQIAPLILIGEGLPEA